MESMIKERKEMYVEKRKKNIEKPNLELVYVSCMY